MPTFHCSATKVTTSVIDQPIVAETPDDAASEFFAAYGIWPESIGGREVAAICEGCMTVLYDGEVAGNDDQGNEFCVHCCLDVEKVSDIELDDLDEVDVPSE